MTPLVQTAVLSPHRSLEQYARWRRTFAQKLIRLTDWLGQHDLTDEVVIQCIDQLNFKIGQEKVLIAFVAEFSRGKSELINAIFFAQHGRRILPASAGRTTMCPVELGYDPSQPQMLSLLPIETRLTDLSMDEWRARPHDWHRMPLSVDDPAQLAHVMHQVTEVVHVTPEKASALGLLQADEWAAQAMSGGGLVEVPKWRHALVNIAHPLLEQGLVVLDTPGLNAIGAEPELTLNLLPQAHAIVFVLGADTGVTQSDLQMWRQHLMPPISNPDARVVVLNKIDTMWDELLEPLSVTAQIEKQCRHSARVLGVDVARVMALSAQKGLLAKIKNDGNLLERSGLLQLENLLTHGLLAQRHGLLLTMVQSCTSQLVSHVSRLIHIRSRDLAEQLQELEDLRGKNLSVIQHMRRRIELEQREFDGHGDRMQAIKLVHARQMRDVLRHVAKTNLKQSVLPLMDVFKSAGLKIKLRKTYAQTFDQLRQSLVQLTEQLEETAGLLALSFDQLNAQAGLSLQVPDCPNLQPFMQELIDIEQNHAHYLGLGYVYKLTQADFCRRLARALTSRLRVVFDSIVMATEAWSGLIVEQMDAQHKNRRQHFMRRIEAVVRIQDAAGGLDSKSIDLQSQLERLRAVRTQLVNETADLVSMDQEAWMAVSAHQNTRLD